MYSARSSTFYQDTYLVLLHLALISQVMLELEDNYKVYANTFHPNK